MPGKLGEKGIRVYLTLPVERKGKQGKEIKAEQFTDTVTLRRIHTDRSLDGGSLGVWVFPVPRKRGPCSISGP